MSFRIKYIHSIQTKVVSRIITHDAHETKSMAKISSPLRKTRYICIKNTARRLRTAERVWLCSSDLGNSVIKADHSSF